MLTEVIYISMVGIGVVFSFLFIIFLLLKALKFFAVDDKKVKEKSSVVKSNEVSKKKVLSNDEIEQEVMVAIMAALNECENLEGSRIIINEK